MLFERRNIALILFSCLFVFLIALSIYVFYFLKEDLNITKQAYSSKQEVVLSALTQEYKLSLDEQSLMSKAILPSNDSKFAEFVMTIQKKKECFVQGYYLPCANTIVFEVLQYKQYLNNEYIIVQKKQYHFDSLKNIFILKF